jgi:DNA-binding transcriptional LysR family regulator
MWRLQGPRGTQEISIDSRFSVNDMRVVMQACLAGLGIALVPRVLAAAAIDEGKLARVLPAYQRSGAGLGLQLVYTSRPPLPPAVTAVAEFLLEKLDQGMSRCPEPTAGR